MQLETIFSDLYQRLPVPNVYELAQLEVNLTKISFVVSCEIVKKDDSYTPVLDT